MSNPQATLVKHQTLHHIIPWAAASPPFAEKVQIACMGFKGKPGVRFLTL